MKSLRRTLEELARQRQVQDFHRGLAAGSMAHDPDSVGFLYVQGHVRPYHVVEARLLDAHVACRRLCLPTPTNLFVKDQEAAPGYLITPPANDGLIRLLRMSIHLEVRRFARPVRRFTVVFDREGWSPTFFFELVRDRFDLLTYRKGRTRR